MGDYSWIYYLSCIIWCIAFIGMFFSLSISYMAYENTFKEKIYKKIPSNLNPGELSFLMYKKIIPEVFTATIFVLVKKGILTLKKTKDDISIILNKKDSKLSLSQGIICDILIKDIGNGEKVTFKQIENYSKSSSNCSEFLMNYKIWVKTMIKESSKKKFYESKPEYKQVKLIRNFGIILFFLNIILNYNYVIGYFLLIPSLFIVVYFYKIYKRTKEYNEQYYKWLSFKNYLEDIKNLGYEKEKTGLYLIYGLVLKLPKLEKDLTNFYCIEKLNNLISHTIIMSSLNSNRRIKF